MKPETKDTLPHSEDDFRLGTPAVYHSFNWEGKQREESGEVALNRKPFKDKYGYINPPRTVKGLYLYRDENYSGDSSRFIVPEWENCETFYEYNDRIKARKPYFIRGHEDDYLIPRKPMGSFKPLDEAKSASYIITKGDHDRIAECDCGAKFSYDSKKSDKIWECPNCKTFKHISESVKSTVDLPKNIQELVDQGDVTYRGLGPDKPGVMIKVNGKEYEITIEEFNKLGGIKKIEFSAPYRKE